MNDAKVKPLMIIGPVGAGKSTLLAALGLGDREQGSGPARKTEAITYMSQAIDTPGEMITIPHFFNALLLNSSRAGLVLFLMDGNKPSQLPARLALAMKAPVVGVISKIDLADEEKLAKARNSLTGAGVKKIYDVSSVSGEGLEELKNGLTECGYQGRAEKEPN